MVEKLTQTWITSPKRLLSEIAREACLVHIYPTGPSMGCRYPLSERSLMLGRGEDCDIRLQDHSVSRRHARIEPTTEGYFVHDQQSTNGTFVNDRQLESAWLLQDGDYLRVGNCIYRYLAGGNIEAEYHEEIYRLTIVDALTEIHNKRYFLDFLGRQLSLATRYARPLALAIFDIDKFKSINDQLGHLCGDATLRELAHRVKKAVRKDDLFARYGGEEFAIVMPETVRKDAVQVAEQLRKLVERHPFEYASHQYKVTISVGVSASTGEEWQASSELIRIADENLYQAKRQGRNRVVG